MSSKKSSRQTSAAAASPAVSAPVASAAPAEPKKRAPRKAKEEVAVSPVAEPAVGFMQPLLLIGLPVTFLDRYLIWINRSILTPSNPAAILLVIYSYQNFIWHSGRF